MAKLIEYDPAQVYAVYVDTLGNEYGQPVSDFVENGSLTDPETGDDMPVVRVDVVVH